MNSMLEKQLNRNMTNGLNENVNTILTLNTAQESLRMDENNDGFLDNPLITRYMLFNKWNFPDEKNKSEINVAGRYWNEERVGGQNGYNIDRNEGSNQNNDIVRQISADYQIPLWEFDPVAGTLPGRGLDVDNVHMNTFYAHDYKDPTAFTRGHAMHNLTALMVLDAMINEIILPAQT